MRLGLDGRVAVQAYSSHRTSTRRYVYESIIAAASEVARRDTGIAVSVPDSYALPGSSSAVNMSFPRTLTAPVTLPGYISYDPH